MVEPKNSGSRRRIALSPSSALLLCDHKAEQQAQRILLGTPLSDSDPVFAYPDGQPLARRSQSYLC